MKKLFENTGGNQFKPVSELETSNEAGLQEHNYGMFTINDPKLSEQVKQQILKYSAQLKQFEAAHQKILTKMLSGLGAGNAYAVTRARDLKKKLPPLGVSRKVKSVTDIYGDDQKTIGIGIQFNDGSHGDVFFQDNSL